MEHHGMALEVEELSKGFGAGTNRVTVLTQLSLSLQRGVFEAVMGASGSGKSTLLHLLAGLLTPDAGRIRVGGTEITAMDDNSLTCFRRRRMGMIFQDFNLIPTLNVEENMALPLLLDRREPDRQKMEELLEVLQLTPRRRHMPGVLSGGERQRVAIARALVTTPEVVLADEPTGNLDAPAGQAFCTLLRQMHATQGCTILLVSHDPLVAASADRVHLLRDGAFASSFETGHDAARVSAHYLETMRCAGNAL